MSIMYMQRLVQGKHFPCMDFFLGARVFFLNAISDTFGVGILVKTWQTHLLYSNKGTSKRAMWLYAG